MAENITIARPYAKAVFEQAVSENGLEPWKQILEALAMIASDKTVTALFDNPAVQAEQLLKLFSQVTEKAIPSLSADHKKKLNHFLSLLIEEKRLNVLPEILTGYQRMLDAANDIKPVTVISAYPIDPSRREKMIETLSKYLHSKVAVDFREDTGLIGGAVIRSGNWVMDGSIKGKLQALKDNLLE